MLPEIETDRVFGLLLATAMIGSLIVAGIALSGSNSATAQEDSASARVFHGAPDAPVVDVYVDDQLAVSGVSFGDLTSSLTVDAGDHTVTITEAGNESNILFDGTVSFEAATSYTIAAAPAGTDIGEIEPVILVDDATAPAEGEAAVRLVHLSPDAGTVQVTNADTGEVLFDDLAFRENSEYVIIPAGDYTIEVRSSPAPDQGAGDNATETETETETETPGVTETETETETETSGAGATAPANTSEGEVLATFNISVQSGNAYSAFAVGSVEAAEDTEPFDLIVVTDPVTAEEAETETETETGTETETPGVTETETPGMTETPAG